MTNNVKYLRPIPIKALKGRILVLNDDRALRAKEENARRRALANSYFDQAPSVQNLAKGIYYWATSEPMLFGEDETPYTNKGIAPAVGSTTASAARTVPQAAKYVLQYLPGLAFLSGWFGGNSSQSDTSPVLGVNRTTPIGSPRFLDRAEAETSEGTETTSEDTTKPETQTPPPQNPKKDNDDKKESIFKRESKKVIKNIGNVYGKVLKGGAYVTGLVGIPGGIGYGIYLLYKPKPTAVDSLLELQSRYMMELNKLLQAKLNLTLIDLMKQLLQGTGARPSTDTVVPIPRTSINSSTTSTQSQLDSINNSWYDQLH